jgi:hypothetical protein
MKLHHIAFAAACVAAGSSAFAATTYNFHVAGSSALQKVVAQSITNNCSSVSTYKGLLGTAAAGPLDNANGQAQTLYVCTVSPTSSWGSTYQNNIVNIFLNTQGSAFGVFPVAYGLAIPFINPASCGTSTCTGVTSVIPDAGLSDLEPTAFNAASNHPVDPTVGGRYPAGTTAPAGTVFPELFASYTKVTPSLFASSKIAAVQTFGIAVSDQLLADLQADQGLSATQIPTVSSSAFATIYAPGYSQALGNWQPFFTGTLANASSVNNQVNICSRLPGSGTRASAQALFLQAPFSTTTQAFATAAGDNTGSDGTLSQTIGQNNAGTYEIGEYDNSGAVVGCVQAASTNGAYAIGLLSVDRASGNTSSTDGGTPQHFTFVNLDGSVPNTSAASVGKYQWVYEAYYQISKSAADSAFATAFGNAFKTPANISAVGAPSTNGVMAAIANCPGTPYTGVNTVCSHVSRNGNSSAILQYVQ